MATAVEALSIRTTSDDRIKRFDVHQIVQHAGLMVSFILLVLTGLPMKFNAWAISIWWTGLWGGVEVLRSVHHFSAWIIIIVSVYHVAYLLYSMIVLKRPFPVKMIPRAQDARDMIQEIAYYIGIKKEKPKIDRFNWKEKFDYMALFWGMPVMAGSGLILMFPVFFTKFLPGWIVPAALVAHSDEAMLALTWIFVVHIFFNHFTPGIFPLNTSIFTGKVSRERYKKEHTLEYEQLVESGEVAGD